MAAPNDHTAIAERLEARANEPRKDMYGSVDEELDREAARLLRASADEVERGKRLDDLIVSRKDLLDMMAAKEAAEADLASARKALEPFARAMAEYGDDPAEADGANCWEHSLAMLVTIGDFRRAAEVYASLSGRTGSEAYTAADGPVRDEYSSCSSTQDQDGGGDV